MAKPSGLRIKKPDDYKAIQSEEEASLIPKPSIENEQNSKERAGGGKKKKKKKKKRKKITCWSMITNFTFLFFVVNCLSPIGIFVWWYLLWPDTQIPYIISGIIGLLITVTGYRKFNQLMALMAQTNGFEKNNKKMKKEHHALRNQVNSIKRANKDLKHTEMRLRSANKKNRENLGNFREVQKFMKQMNVKDFDKLSKRAGNVGAKWHDELLRQERDMLHLIFDRYEMGHDTEEGMNEEQFTKFGGCLPDAYQKRFARLGTFDKLCNNKGILEYADFELVLDVFAEMVVDDVDIELQIQKNATPVGNAELLGSPSTISEQDSMMTDYGSDSEEDNNGGGGFLDRLTTWRINRKDEKIRRSQSRNLVVKGKTPTGNQQKGFSSFDIFGDDGGGDNNNNKKKEEQNTLQVEPKHLDLKRTVSGIERLHDADQSLNDDEINFYMQETMRGAQISLVNDNDDNDMP